jgi:hypothetical protein
MDAHLGFGVFNKGVNYLAQQVTVDVLQALAGDTDGDRHVDFTDFNDLANNYTGPGGSGKDWTQGDFDGDGDVDFSDFNDLANNYTGPVIGYSKGKSGDGLSEEQRAGLLSSLAAAAPSGSRATEIEEALASSRVRIALDRLATLRTMRAARAGIDSSVAAHDAVLERLGAEESEPSRTFARRTAWVHQYEPAGMKERPAKARKVLDELLVTDLA